MIGLLQRVTGARVEVAGERIAEIGPGLLVLIGVERHDGPDNAARLLERLLTYRVFPDAGGKMNRSLLDTGGGLMLVPQFTLCADTSSGTRPGLSPAAPPDQGRLLFDGLVALAESRCRDVGSGRFGSDMLVTLSNDGPVTFWLRA